MIDLLRNGVICTVKDVDMPILSVDIQPVFCTFSGLHYTP